MVDLVSGEFTTGDRLFDSAIRKKAKKSPWDWDGFVRSYLNENVFVYYGYHNAGGGVFYKLNDERKELYSSEWGHPMNIPGMYTRFHEVNGRLDKVGLRGGMNGNEIVYWRGE